MAISIFDLFSIGIGPSSSHTVGPMRAANQFVCSLEQNGLEDFLSAIKVDLYGSLALTGKGHCTDMAILLGLEGDLPHSIDPCAISSKIERIRRQKEILILGKYLIPFDEDAHLLFHYDKQLPYHPNAMRLTAYNKDKKEIFQKLYYSIGGGFIVEHESLSKSSDYSVKPDVKVPFPFKTAKELLLTCKREQMTIAQLMLENEKTWRSALEIKEGIHHIWNVMQNSIEMGCTHEGVLPGGLNVKRRAPGILRRLNEKNLEGQSAFDPAQVMDWVSLWAIAVNEENAAGGRVVTAPTNGSAGVIPAVVQYYLKMTSNPTEEGIEIFFLTAGAMGILYKEGASISAAEMGCMGEVGVACSMAAAGLAAALGASNEQIENAAEIGMEHNLGLTCDPIRGLVQIPCIERNTMGANKAINAERLARLYGDGTHHVSLDQVIATMRQTGNDMKSIYKETALGGLAVNVPEC